MTARKPHKHPFSHGWWPARADMGFDGTFVKEMAAFFAGVIAYAGPFAGWNGSHGLIIEAGHDVENVDWWCPTRRIYVVEGVAPIVHSGQHVRGGEIIAHAAHSPYGDSYGHGSLGAIEMGVAAVGPLGQQTNAYAIELGVGTAAARDMVLAFCRGVEEVLGVQGPTSTDTAGRP